VEVRSRPQHDVILRHEFTVIALARDLPEPVADLTCFHGTHPRLPCKLANSGPDLPGRFWAKASRLASHLADKIKSERDHRWTGSPSNETICLPALVQPVSFIHS
jgi:hypothetical protein